MFTTSRKIILACFLAAPVLLVLFSFNQPEQKEIAPVEIGTGRIDITPDYPVRLT